MSARQEGQMAVFCISTCSELYLEVTAAHKSAVLFGCVPLMAADDHEGGGGLPGSQGRMVVPQQSPAHTPLHMMLCRMT